MNARNRLDGIERRVGIEGQQHEATMRDLRASLDQRQEDLQALSRSSTVCQVDIQSWDARLFEFEETIFHFRVDMERGLKECREGMQRIQNLPESGSVSTSDHRERMKAVQQVLDEYRTQLGTHEKKLQDSERHMRRLQEEATTHRLQPKPEGPEGLPSDVGSGARQTRLASHFFRKLPPKSRIFRFPVRQNFWCSSNLVHFVGPLMRLSSGVSRWLL